MPKLVLKFENSVLKEVPVGSKEVSIGRSPENGLVIDNPAVSHYHARVFNEEGRLMLEDFRFPSCTDCKLLSGCAYIDDNEMDCWGNSPSCAECLWARRIIACP